MMRLFYIKLKEEEKKKKDLLYPKASKEREFGPKAMVLQAWYLVEQHLHHLGTC